MIPARPRARRRAAAVPARIDVYVHGDRDGGRVVEVLEHFVGRFNQVVKRLGALEAQGVQIMATIDEVNASMDDLAKKLAELAREVGVLVAGGTGATAEQLGTLNERVKGLAQLAAGADPNPDS